VHWVLARATSSSSDDPPIYEATHNVRPRGAATQEDSNELYGAVYGPDKGGVLTAAVPEPK
jgi:hypothetical protein